MDASRDINNLRENYAVSYASQRLDIPRLQQILSKQSGELLEYETTAKIAYELIELYKALAGDRTIVRDARETHDGLQYG